MNIRISVLIILFTIFTISGFAQEKSKKQLKEDKKLEKQQQLEALLNSKTFVFNANTAIPQGSKPVNLTAIYYVKFSPDAIESYMPFYGNAYNGAGIGGDTGMKFEGKPEDFTVAKGKKNYIVNALVAGQNDTYQISLSVGFKGSATLSIGSNNRSNISYNGEITAPKSQKKK